MSNKLPEIIGTYDEFVLTKNCQHAHAIGLMEEAYDSGRDIAH